MPQIKSRWEVPYKRMKSHHVSYLLKANSPVIDIIARSYLIKRPELNFDDLRCLVREGFWMALKSYNPNKGKLTTYATYYCKNAINEYIRKFARNKELNVRVKTKVLNNSYEIENDIIEAMLFKNFLNNLSKENKEIIETFCYADCNLSEAAKILKISQFKFRSRLKMARKEAKKCLKKKQTKKNRHIFS